MAYEYTILWIDNHYIRHVDHVKSSQAAARKKLDKLFIKPEFRFGQVLDYYGNMKYHRERSVAV